MRCSSLTMLAFGASLASAMPYPQHDQKAATVKSRSPVLDAPVSAKSKREFAFPSLVDFWNQKSQQSESSADQSTTVGSLPILSRDDEHTWTPVPDVHIQKREAHTEPSPRKPRALPPMPYSADYIQYTWKRATTPENPTRPITNNILQVRPKYRRGSVAEVPSTVEDITSAGNFGLKKRRGEVTDVVKLRRKDWRLRVKGARLIEV